MFVGHPRRPLVLATAALLGLLAACETEPSVAPGPVVDLEDYLIAPTPASADGLVAFSVDSTLYDPDVSGTAVRRSRQSWSLERVTVDTTDDRLFLVTRRDSAGIRGRQYWRWGTTAGDEGVVHTLDGITYLSLTSPLRVGSTWDPLRFTDPQLVLPVEAEPIALHKDWGARIDSLGEYALPGGGTVPAVWVSLADSENRIELRRVREVYGEGVGLLERHADVLDSQTLDQLPWEQKAERGFQVVIRRTR